MYCSTVLLHNVHGGSSQEDHVCRTLPRRAHLWHGQQPPRCTTTQNSWYKHPIPVSYTPIITAKKLFAGLDPARPLIDRFATKYFRLTKDDAHQVQIIHTNAGFLGEVNQVGHIDFCVNGGIIQPGCKGNRLSKYAIEYARGENTVMCSAFRKSSL